MKRIKAIIVDDEAEARDIIANLLNDFSDVEVVSKDDSVDEAFRSVRKYRPDLIFLDIYMPGKDGFELLRMLKNSPVRPTVIFVTAYDRYAIEAIKHAAFDYLLKPVGIEELRDTIRRYREDSRARATIGRIETLLQALHSEKIMFSSRAGGIYIDPADIVYCRADGNYTDLFLKDGSISTVKMNIGKLEEALPSVQFSKISRSAVINRQYLYEINRKEKCCKLSVNGQFILLPVSPRYMNLLGIGH